ncbi:hypothetical protein BGLT_04987 [Caballeronia glathei]|jgi:hypothetical protein|uniref:Uncharacterized protein n=1 Tax=Caballeronia glathei TaxID=60547 RepID=A0A069PP99_9BURK|nr:MULTISPECIES: hypothetical protein [Burkholderiaceae]KDR39121.1 hypothetical protein BG61_34695 [Caballeronia glathei]TCK37199.1 hypothetical protein B0G84_6256 [Paraburkholderia sp. BL8N3]CDY78934.1 hypothetical protein BGLT_04987 [Caballeronia glathei]
MPKLSEMQPGDLISDLDDDDHFMIWVGGNEEIVENVDTGDYAGIFRHSKSKITKRINGENNSDDDSEGEMTHFAVFRCEDTRIAKQAAEFAIEWATSKSDDLFTVGKASGDAFNLKIPFNQGRLVHDRAQNFDDWDVRSLFRALRVLARHESGVPVSIKGWTCSSFATYCYQAAALKVLFQSGPIAPGVLKMVKDTNSEKFLKIKNDLNIIQLLFGELTEILRKLIPHGLLVDGKAIDATSLLGFLRKDNNGFTNLGDIIAG